MNRLYVDLKEDCNGDVVGRVGIPADRLFALEAIAEVIEQFSKACGVPALEVLNDIKGTIR